MSPRASDAGGSGAAGAARARPPGAVRSRRRRLCLTLLVPAWCLLYAAGYWQLRRNHDLVHHATYYTAPSGKPFRTDSILLGEWRTGRVAYELLAGAYRPLRAVEAAYWRGCPARP